MTLGYVAEAPLFRVSYRLVFGESGTDGALQAWALLHNDADEDWREVRVHLVFGRRDEFRGVFLRAIAFAEVCVTADDSVPVCVTSHGQSTSGSTARTNWRSTYVLALRIMPHSFTYHALDFGRVCSA